MKNPFSVLRFGLGFVFLSNALAAWFMPDEFRDLVTGSFITSHISLISTSAWIVIVGINDSLLALIFLFNLKSVMKKALVWATIWIIGVMLVIWEPLDILEHLGFLSISIALLAHLKQSSIQAT